MSQSEERKTQEAFFKKSVDLLAIYTGDTGRIQYGLEYAEKFKASKIFISGVYNKNSLKKLVQLNWKDKSGPLIDMNQVVIDYMATNTIENILFTLKYIEENSTINSVIIVSHDYHILRIKLLLSFLANDLKGIQFYFMPIHFEEVKWRTVKITAKEIIKIYKSFFLMLIWDRTELFS